MGEEGEKFIGFSLLADQLQRKTVKRGFEFTLMVVGESGLGKSTLVNSLFLTDLYRNRKLPPVSERIKKTTEIEKTTIDIEENGVKLRLTIVDTPGFGDGLEGTDAWQACVKYVDEQLAQYFEMESSVNRRSIVDTRVHCCLYFLSPYGHGLRPLDLEFMKRLQYKVNIVPVLAKADSLTKAELAAKKKRIMAELGASEIELYQFPDTDSDEDEEFKAENDRLKSSLPFAVVGANTLIQVGSKKIRGRQYPWGVVDIEDTTHSDFSHLKRFLIQTHMQDLKDVTHDVHYENFRIACLKELKSAGGEDGARQQASQPHSQEETYEDPETLIMLQQKEAEIKRMQEMLAQMQQKLSSS